MDVRRESWGALQDGRPVDAITISASGYSARFITYGGILTSFTAPDRDGRAADVVLGLDSLAAYEAGHPYFGALVGRFANRIGGASFEIDGTRYRVARNHGPKCPDGKPAHHLHGGFAGFDKKVWIAETFTASGEAGVVFSTVSPDGEEGYPGALSAEVRCSLSEAGELTFDYTATADAPTPCNLTNHSYWNLAGEASGDVLAHVVTLHCDSYLPVDSELIPTGEIAPVDGTPMDFRAPKAIGRDLGLVPGGYDHCFVGAGAAPAAGGPGAPGNRMYRIASVSETGSGRRMDVHTNKPAVQFYSGNFLTGSLTGKGGVPYAKHAGFCLETEHFPDAMNHAEFPSAILRPGETYRFTTRYSFGAE
jgi:aldose 1-epimerase